MAKLAMAPVAGVVVRSGKSVTRGTAVQEGRDICDAFAGGVEYDRPFPPAYYCCDVADRLGLMAL